MCCENDLSYLASLSYMFPKLVRFLLRSGAKVYFLPGFLAEQKPRLVNGNKTPKTGRWYVLWGGHLPLRPQRASTGVGQLPLAT